MQINSNFIRDNTYIGIRTTSNDMIDIQGNEIWNHTGDTGIQIWNSQNITVDNNHLDDNGGNGFDDWDSSIYSEGGSDIVISNNQVLNSNYFAIRIWDQPDIVIEGNNIENTLASASVMVLEDIWDHGSVNGNTISSTGWHAIFVDSCYDV